MSSVWLPQTHNYRSAIAVDKAVREYDERLGFGFNRDTQQWVIYMRHGMSELSSEQLLPILGFHSIPSTGFALKELYRTDARRNGEQIIEKINRHNKAIQDKFEAEASDASGVAAEALEWGFRKAGEHPNPSVFFPEKES